MCAGVLCLKNCNSNESSLGGKFLLLANGVGCKEANQCSCAFELDQRVANAGCWTRKA